MSLKIRDQLLAEHTVQSIIDGLFATNHTPTKADLIEHLASVEDIYADDKPYWAKRILKYASEQGWLRYEADDGFYVRTTLPAELPDQSEPTVTAHNRSRHAANGSHTKTEQNQTHDHITGLSHAARAFCLIISAAAILAVVSINGLFAASIAGTAQLAAILITAMVSIDLMRPFLVAMALISFRNRLWLRFTGALTLALVLAPLSVFTSFSMLSAEFSKGADSRQNALQSAGSTEAARATLDTEIARLRAVSATQWAEWQSECANGGCGANAGRLQGAAERTDTRIAALVSERKALSGVPQVSPDRTSRITTSLTLFGIPEAIVVQIAPLLLALGLELAAVLGPAILLVPVTRKRPVRAPRFANPDSTEGGPL